jgi:hypothetical protein
MADVTPERWSSSVAVTDETATFPDPSEARALETVRLSDAMVVDAPVRVACLELIWV